MGSPPAPNLAPLGGTGPRIGLVRGPYLCSVRTPVGDGVAELGPLAFDEGREGLPGQGACAVPGDLGDDDQLGEELDE